MDFKKVVWDMTEDEFTDCYKQLDCRAKDRASDLNKKSINLMLKMLNKDSDTLLDVGCGRAHWLSILKRETGLKLTGCDVFDSLELEDIKYKKGTIEKLPFPDKSVDIVTCHHTIEHIRDIKKAVEELKRIARRQLIIVTPRQHYFYYTLDLHLHFFPEKEYLVKLLDLPVYECFDCNGDWCYIANL